MDKKALEEGHQHKNNHKHNHAHGHNIQVDHSKSFAIGIALNVIFVAVEVIYGFIANSSALLADAGHNAGDVLGLVFAWAAGSQVMIVAGIGIVINAFTAMLFYKGQKTDLNIKGAFLHMAADAGVSLGVVIAGLLITLTGKTWIDPAISFLIIAVILWGTWRLFSESVDLALDAVPKHIKIAKVREFLLNKQGVTSIHDLHIWAMSTTQVALTVHLVMPQGASDQFISQLQKELSDTFGIGHSTFQIENKDMSSEFFLF